MPPCRLMSGVTVCRDLFHSGSLWVNFSLWSLEFGGPYFEFLVLQVHEFVCVMFYSFWAALWWGFVRRDGFRHAALASWIGLCLYFDVFWLLFSLSVAVLQILFKFCVFHSKLCMCVIVLFSYFIWFHSQTSHTSLRIYTGNILELPFFPFALYSFCFFMLLV